MSKPANEAQPEQSSLRAPGDVAPGRRADWSDQVTTWRLALGAAEHLGDRAKEAEARQLLAGGLRRLGHVAEAHDNLEHALALYGKLGDHDGQASIHLHIGAVFEKQGRFVEAIDHDHRALDIFQEAADRSGQAMALNNLGWNHVLLGESAMVEPKRSATSATANTPLTTAAPRG